MTTPCIGLRCGLNLPMIGLGVWEVPPDLTTKTVSTAIKLGYRHFDTAQYYHNERETYAAVRDSGLPREDFFLTTKLNPGNCRTPRAAREAVRQSLDSMGGRIDLLLIHWPFNGDEDAWRVMQEFVRQGSIRALGLSNYSADAAERLLGITEITPEVNQIEYHPYNASPDALRDFPLLNMVVEAWSPLGAGRMKLLQDPVICRIASAHGVTPAQVILRWDLHKGIITIPRSVNEAHQRENLTADSFALDDSEISAIDALNRFDALWPI